MVKLRISAAITELFCMTSQRDAVPIHRDNFPFLGAFRKIAKSAYWLRHVRLSICPHGTNSAPTGRILMKLDISDFFSKIC